MNETLYQIRCSILCHTKAFTFCICQHDITSMTLIQHFIFKVLHRTIKFIEKNYSVNYSVKSNRTYVVIFCNTWPGKYHRNSAKDSHIFGLLGTSQMPQSLHSTPLYVHQYIYCNEIFSLGCKLVLWRSDE